MIQGAERALALLRLPDRAMISLMYTETVFLYTPIPSGSLMYTKTMYLYTPMGSRWVCSSCRDPQSKLLRSNCQNNVVTQVTLLNCGNHHGHLNHMVRFTEPLKVWQGHTDKTLKDVQSSRDWLILQLQDPFLSHQKQMLQVLVDPVVLKECGYYEFERFATSGIDNSVVQEDDDFALFAGDVVLGLIARRRRRLFYLTNCWPHRHYRSLISADEAALTVNEFHKHYTTFEFWSAAESKRFNLNKMLERSGFNMTSVKQLLGAYSETQFTPHKDILQVAEDKAKVVMSNNIVESINNAQNNCQQAKGSVKFRRPQRSMAASIAAHVADGRYDYEVPEPQVPLNRKGLKLSAKTLGRRPDPATVPIDDICSTISKNTWFSPKAQAVGVPGADSQVLELARQLGDKDIIEGAFMSSCCHWSHHMVIKRTGCGATDFDWHCVLWNYVDSAGFGWPVTLNEIPGYRGSLWVDFREDCSDIKTLVIADWSNIVARHFRFRSLSFQKKSFPLARGRWPDRLRAIIDTPEMPLLTMAAERAWWSLDKSMVKRAGSRMGFDIADEPTLMDTLFSLTKEVTNQSDESVMGFCPNAWSSARSKTSSAWTSF